MRRPFPLPAARQASRLHPKPLILGSLAWLAGAVQAQVPSLAEQFAVKPAAVTAFEILQPFERRWQSVPRVKGRLTAKDVGLVINKDDAYSVEVGEYYARARGLSENQILRLSVPTKSSLSREEFADLNRRVNEFFGDRVQALVLAWRSPYGVECNSITGALAMGFDAGLCSDPNPCAVSKPSRYFGSSSTRPYDDYGMRLGMLLAAPSSQAAKALIDRGVKADGTQAVKGAPPSNVHFVITSDNARSSRQWLFPPPGPISGMGLTVHVDQVEALKNSPRVLVYQTGRTEVNFLDTIDFLPGALGDHLTSFGGVLDKPHGQMTVLSWIQAGATATYGTTSEPCSYPQKFPHPQMLVLFYSQGATAVETYWKSVAWPQQGLFVGEPLAAPFDRALVERESTR